MFFWIFGLILSLVVALFASQNPALIELGMFTYRLQPVSLTVVILVSALTGALISFFFMGVRLISLKSELRKTQKILDKASALEASRKEEVVKVEKEGTQEMEKVRQNLEVKEVENLELKKRLEQLEQEVDRMAEEKE